jgi:hypothetical protein
MALNGRMLNELERMCEEKYEELRRVGLWAKI